MSIKEQVLALTDRLKSAPSEAVVRVAGIFVKPARDYWAAQSLRHLDVMNTYPEGSAMRKAAEAKYSEAFDHWHRLNFFVLKIEEAEKFKGFGIGASFGKQQPTEQPTS